IQIESFLGNALLFYGHHGFFSRRIGAFNRLAEEVNARVPNTRWRGLGEIARHEYLVRLRADSDYVVMAFSSQLSLANTSGRDSVFPFSKLENGRPAIVDVRVDGRRYPYQLHDGYLDITIAAPKESSRDVSITYQNDLTLTPSSSSDS